MEQPDPDLNIVINNVAHRIGDWWFWVCTTGLAIVVGLIWRTSADRERSAERIAAHNERLDRHEIRITAIEAGQTAIAVKLGEIPTRAEFTAQSDRINDRFDRIDTRLDRAISKDDSP